MTLPNMISLARLLSVPFNVWLILIDQWRLALVIFCLAGLSDAVDGLLAKRFGMQSRLGRYLDPIADKVLTASAFIFLSAQDQGFCPTWVVVVILAREFLVTGLRQIAVERGRVIAADWSGKWKTGFQIGFCITALIWLFLQALGQEEFFLAILAHPTFWIMPTFLWLSLALTVVSGIQYAWNGRDLLQN